MAMSRVLGGCLGVAGLLGAAWAQSPRERDYYTIADVPIPEGIVLECGALELLPGDVLAAATRRGEIWLVDHALERELRPDRVRFTRFAAGLHEPLGLAWRDGSLWVTQRCELSKLTDLDGDRRADDFETVSAEWGVNGDYHEYAFGSKPDRNGDIWIVLCLTGSFSSKSAFRGWCLRVTPDGETIPTASGIRSPGGIGANAAGDMFFCDNQGPWNGSSSLKHLVVGSFQGHPAGNEWYRLTDAIGPRPPEPRDGSRMLAERERIPQLVPPAVVLPHGKLGQSPSGIVCDTTGGRFGPFTGQLFVGEQTYSEVQRIWLEKVNGVYQGVAFPFLKGFASGNVAMLMTPNGSLFVGGTDRGWTARGGKRYALQRVDWTGRTPFEVLTMSARPDGFELTFTEEVDAASAGDPSSYALLAYTYVYRAKYGSPIVDAATPEIVAAQVAPDRRRVRLRVEGLVRGHVHELHVDGVRSVSGREVLHPVAFYTLNEIPAGREGEAGAVDGGPGPRERR